MSIDKVEVGKTYKLIDKEGYLDVSLFTKELFNRCFTNDQVTLDWVENEVGGIFDKVTLRPEIIIGGDLCFPYFDEVTSEVSEPDNIPFIDEPDDKVVSIVERRKQMESKLHSLEEESFEEEFGNIFEDIMIGEIPGITDNIKEGLCKFSECSREDVYCLVDAYLNSQIIQYRKFDTVLWEDMKCSSELCFNMHYYYRIKPEIQSYK